MVEKVIITLERKSGGHFQRNSLPLNMGDVLKLRDWCRNNIKYSWRTYHLEQSSHAEVTEQYDFIVFEFTDAKDAMLFKLYTGK